MKNKHQVHKRIADFNVVFDVTRFFRHDGFHGNRVLSPNAFHTNQPDLPFEILNEIENNLLDPDLVILF